MKLKNNYLLFFNVIIHFLVALIAFDKYIVAILVKSLIRAIRKNIFKYCIFPMTFHVQDRNLFYLFQ